MNNSDLPAGTNAPAPQDIMTLCADNSDYMLANIYQSGLTKREHFAGLAMANMASQKQFCSDYQRIAEMAVANADALLKELDK